MLDVTSQGGSLVIAHREVSVAELDRLNGKVRIAFVLEERSVLEFRVYVDGRTSYIVADAPYVARIEGQFAADEQAATAGDLDAGALSLQAQIRAVLRLLSPHTVRDFDKKRFGRAGDGGYVCVDDFDGIDVALSLGINDEIS